MPLPSIPGYSFNKNLGNQRFHRSQQFSFCNGVRVLMGSEKAGIGRELNSCQLRSIGERSQIPAWLAFDKQVLCFDAYIQEVVLESRQESHRIRKFKIHFYLEDNTIEVSEPKCKNSGLPQGTFIRRHRIPLPPPKDDQFYNVYHFNINQQMVLYSHTFTITSCDQFTRSFLTKLGVPLRASTPLPKDPYSSLREQMEQSMRPRRPYERRDTLKQFLEHDGKYGGVLRFYCLWDDTVCKFGDARELVLLYYLADDTVEVQEVSRRNGGRDTAKLLRRSKLPKQASMAVQQPGQVSDSTVLNVVSTRSPAHYILDTVTATPGAGQEEFYRDSDLAVGGEVNIWGRKVLICDCDDFTKTYYRSKYGIEDFTPMLYRAPLGPVAPQRPLVAVPPYTGFGSEEDSLCSCQPCVLPKPPQKDFMKMMEKDRNSQELNMLRFSARMVTDDPFNRDRVFVIAFFLSDDTIVVFELPRRNSGMMAGKFLERGRVRKPGQEVFKSEPSQYFGAQDLYVGATINLNEQPFLLVDADEYALRYMERHPQEFPQADVGVILSKLRSMPEEQQEKAKRFLALSDPGNAGSIPYEAFRDMLAGTGCGLTQHEVLTLARRYAEFMQPMEDVGPLLAAAQDSLRRENFDLFPEMARAFKHKDVHSTGRLPTKEVRTICKAIHLPVPEDLLKTLLSSFTEGEEIDHHAFLAGINWKENPAPRIQREDALQFLGVRTGEAHNVSVKNVQYSAMLGEVFSRGLPGNDPAPVALAMATDVST